jgi:hypothetical protein
MKPFLFRRAGALWNKYKPKSNSALDIGELPTSTCAAYRCQPRRRMIRIVAFSALGVDDGADASIRLFCPSIKLAQVGVSESSKSAVKRLGPGVQRVPPSCGLPAGGTCSTWASIEVNRKTRPTLFRKDPQHGANSDRGFNSPASKRLDKAFRRRRAYVVKRFQRTEGPASQLLPVRGYRCPHASFISHCAKK